MGRGFASVALARACRLLFFATAAFLIMIAAGCGGSSNSSSNGMSGSAGNGVTPGSSNPGSTGGNGSSGASNSATPRFVFALISTGVSPSGVSAFHIDPNSGALSNFTFTTIPSNNGLSGMTAVPRTSYVFVSDWNAHTIATFKADPNSGALAQVSTLSIPQLSGNTEMITDPAGKFLFATNDSALQSQIFVFSIGSSGSLTPVPGSPFSTAGPVSSLSTDAAGKFLFGSFENQIFGFSIGSDGSLVPTPDSPVTVRAPFINPDKGATAVEPVLDPQARFLYVADDVNPVMYVYSVSPSGSLTEIAGSPFQIGVGGGPTAVDPQGRFVFLGSAPQIVSLKINQSTGAVTPAPGSPYDNGPFRSGGAPIAQAVVDPSGKFVLFSDSDQTKITVFSIDQSTGALSNVAGSPFLAASQQLGGGSPTSIAVTH